MKSARSLVGHDCLFDLGDGQTFTCRAALMKAVVTVGIILVAFAENADFIVTIEDDPTLAIFQIGNFCHELLRRALSLPCCYFLARPWLFKDADLIEIYLLDGRAYMSPHARTAEKVTKTRIIPEISTMSWTDISSSGALSSCATLTRGKPR